MFLNNKEYSSFWLNGKNYDKGYLNGKQIFGETLHAHTIKILARATTIGATQPTNIANFDSYVRSMYQIWMDYCDVFFRFRGTGDANFKRINLVNPDGVLADFYGGYTLDISGIKGNGINAYVDTNFNPSLLVSGQKYQLNDASRGVVIVEESTDATKIIDGVASANGSSFLSQNTMTHYINNSATLTATQDNTGTGYHSINRVSSSQINFVNKDIESIRTRVSSGIINTNQLLMRRNGGYSNGKFSSYFVGKSIPFSTSQLIRAAENADMANLGITQIA